MIYNDFSEEFDLCCDQKVFELYQIEFSRNYTKMAMLSFLYCFVVKGKLI